MNIMSKGNKILSALLAILIIFAAGLSALAEQAGEKVTSSEMRRVAAKKITISGSKYVAVGKKVTLTAAVLPEKASQKVTWKSSDKGIAAVSSKGVVTGISAGKVTITATSKSDPKVQKTWRMTVTPAPVKKISIKAPSREMDLSKSVRMTLTASVSPGNAAGAVLWSSSKPSVARISSKGIVTAKSRGSTVITAAAVDGSGVKAKITIRVIDSSAPENPNPHEIYVTAYEGNKFTFFMYYPEMLSTYTVNRPDTYMHEVDFQLGFFVKDDSSSYLIWVKHSKEGETQQNLSLSQMKSELCFVNTEEDSFDHVSSLKHTVRGKNIRWTVTFPSGFNLKKAVITESFVVYNSGNSWWDVGKPLLP